MRVLNKDEGDTFIRAIEVSNGHMDSGIRTGKVPTGPQLQVVVGKQV